MRRFATTIVSATQRYNIVTMLFGIVTTLFQLCNAVLRLKSWLRIVSCNITFTNQKVNLHQVLHVARFVSQRMCNVQNSTCTDKSVKVSFFFLLISPFLFPPEWTKIRALINQTNLRMQRTFFHFLRGFRNEDGNHFIFLKSRVSRSHWIDDLWNKNKIHETNATHTEKLISTVANLFVEGPNLVPLHVNICLWRTLTER